MTCRKQSKLEMIKLKWKASGPSHLVVTLLCTDAPVVQLHSENNSEKKNTVLIHSFVQQALRANNLMLTVVL